MCKVQEDRAGGLCVLHAKNGEAECVLRRKGFLHAQSAGGLCVFVCNNGESECILRRKGFLHAQSAGGLCVLYRIVHFVRTQTENHRKGFLHAQSAGGSAFCVGKGLPSCAKCRRIVRFRMQNGESECPEAPIVCLCNGHKPCRSERSAHAPERKHHLNDLYAQPPEVAHGNQAPVAECQPRTEARPKLAHQRAAKAIQNGDEEHHRAAEACQTRSGCNATPNVPT